MSVQSEIDRISGNVSDTMSALSEYGVDTTGANSDDMAGLVRAIPKATIVQETGDSEEAVMSQAAVTRELDKLTDEIADYLPKNQGAENVGKILAVGTDGNLVLVPMPEGGASGDVIGTLDESNNILLTGDLADGTYTIKYEMDDGSIVNIGSLVVSGIAYVTVTNNLTNCTNSNSATQAVKGESYSATITAVSSYELSSVVVTMGGSPVTVSGGVIDIAEVTGDIVITAVAEVAGPAYTNLLPQAVDASGNDFVGTNANGGDGYEYGYRIGHGDGTQKAQENVYCSGFMPATLNDVIRIKGIAKATMDTHNVIAFYDESKTRVNALYMLEGSGGVAIDGDYYTITPNQSFGTSFAFFRFSCGSITDDTIVTVNEEIG